MNPSDRRRSGGGGNMSKAGCRVNWRWVRGRLAGWRCGHEWTTGDQSLLKGGVGHAACGKCGTWRWWPVIRAASSTYTVSD